MKVEMKDEKLMERLLREMMRLKEIISSSNDKRMVAWFSRLDMKARWNAYM